MKRWPVSTFVYWQNGSLRLDLQRYLSSPEFEKLMQETRAFEERLIKQGILVDLTKKKE